MMISSVVSCLDEVCDLSRLHASPVDVFSKAQLQIIYAKGFERSLKCSLVLNESFREHPRSHFGLARFWNIISSALALTVANSIISLAKKPKEIENISLYSIVVRMRVENWRLWRSESACAEISG